MMMRTVARVKTGAKMVMEEVGMGKVAKVPVALVVVRMGGDPLLEVSLHLSYYPAHAALGGEYTNLAFFLLIFQTMGTM